MRLQHDALAPYRVRIVPREPSRGFLIALALAGFAAAFVALIVGG